MDHSSIQHSGVYLHVPFCKHKCGYCDFYSLANKDYLIKDYIDSLCREIQLYSKDTRFSSLTYDTIYFGGGTPSLLSPKTIQTIIEILHKSFHFSSNIEVTLETNPGTVTREKLLAFQHAGVNRISLGFQSIHDNELKKLDREHTSKEALDVYKWTRKAGFSNISLDLMFSIPGQTFMRWQETVKEVIALEPEHISTYSLTIEPNTPFSHLVKLGKLRTFSEREDRRRYQFVIEQLESAGYEHYEISNFAQKGFRSRHNSKYWHGVSYLGLGTSAHSFVKGERFWNPRSIDKYRDRLLQNKLPVEGHEILSRNDKIFEYLFLSLRVCEGLNIHDFEERFQVDFKKTYQFILKRLLTAKEKLVVIEDGYLKLTRNGRFVCDEICSQFYTS